MTTVAYLTSSDMVPGQVDTRGDLFELELQLAALVPACAQRGVALELCVWDEPDTARRVEAGAFAAVVVGTAWDYHARSEEFLATMDRFGARVPVLNPPKLLRWSAHKSYLRSLAAAGVRVVPTVWADRVDLATLRDAAAVLGSDRLVAKPIVGAGADRQVRWDVATPLPPAAQCPPGAALVQPFVPAIQTEGELSFLYFGGTFSHALRKRPRGGDYRVQSIYGGTEAPYHPTDAECAATAAVLAAVPGCTPDALLYARVDLVRAADGGLMLMELELVEPYLYPEQGPGLGGAFATALSSLLVPLT